MAHILTSIKSLADPYFRHQKIFSARYEITITFNESSDGMKVQKRKMLLSSVKLLLLS